MSDNQKIYYIHAFVGHTNGRATLAIKPVRMPDRNPDAPFDIKASIAWCSPNDRFCRALGRKIAFGRLEKNKTFTALDGAFDGTITRDLLVDVLLWCTDSWVKRPQWARGETLHLENPNKVPA